MSTAKPSQSTSLAQSASAFSKRDHVVTIPADLIITPQARAEQLLFLTRTIEVSLATIEFLHLHLSHSRIGLVATEARL